MMLFASVPDFAKSMLDEGPKADTTEFVVKDVYKNGVSKAQEQSPANSEIVTSVSSEDVPKFQIV
jgi:hypothetical protein